MGQEGINERISKKINEKISQELNKQGVAEPEETRPIHGIDWTAIIESIVEHDGPVKIPEPFTEPWLNDLLEAAIDYACQAQSSERDQRQVRQLKQQLANAKHSHQIELERMKAEAESGFKRQLEQARGGNGKLQEMVREERHQKQEAQRIASEAKQGTQNAIERIESLQKQLEMSRARNGILQDQTKKMEQKLSLSEACERATENKHSEAIKRIDELRAGMTEVQNFWRNAQWAKERAERENTRRKEVIRIALEGLGLIVNMSDEKNSWAGQARATINTINQILRLIERDRMAPEQKEPKPDQGGSQRHAPGVEVPPGSYYQHPRVPGLFVLKEEIYQGPHASLAKALQRLGNENTTRDSSPGYLVNKMLEATREMRIAHGAGPLWDLVEEAAETICGAAALMATQAHEKQGRQGHDG